MFGRLFWSDPRGCDKNRLLVRPVPRRAGEEIAESGFSSRMNRNLVEVHTLAPRTSRALLSPVRGAC